jgi:dihydroflavonol-4-reductase
MKALVTGGLGFVGRHLVELLTKVGVDVRVIDLPGRSAKGLPAGVEFVAADIRDRQAMRRAAKGCGHVYHLAANPQLWTLRRGHFAQVNEYGTRNVLDSAIEAGAERIVHCSTESILTRSRQLTPITAGQRVIAEDVIGPYCRSKWRAERYAMRLAASGAPVLVVNPTLPVGPADWGRSPPTQMILDCALGRRAAYLDADLNLVSVRDVARGLFAAAERGRPGQRYLLGAENWTIRHLFDWIARRCGVPGPTWKVPYPAALGVALVSEWVADVFTKRIPAATITGVRLTRRTMRFDARPCWKELGICPEPVTLALSHALDWYRRVGWLSDAPAESDAG